MWREGLAAAHDACACVSPTSLLTLALPLPPLPLLLCMAAPHCIAGSVKIVVATNVAETSITIDDVTCVIDCGRVKEMRFDAARGIARLQETFVSQVGGRAGGRAGAGSWGWLACGAGGVCGVTRRRMQLAASIGPANLGLLQASAQQRRGRAGRVRPGVCYRLFSSRTWDRMPRDTPPEIQRAPLQVRALNSAELPARLAAYSVVAPIRPALACTPWQLRHSGRGGDAGCTQWPLHTLELLAWVGSQVAG